MIIIGDLVKGVKIYLNPSSQDAVKTLRIMDSMFFYYKFALLPIILALIVVYLFGSISALLKYTLLLSIIGSYVLGYPIIFLIEAGIIYFFDSIILHKLKGEFEAVLTAVVFGTFPAISLLWLTDLLGSATGVLGIAGLIFSLLISVWGLYVLISSLSGQDKISIGDSAVAVLVPLIIIFVFVAIFGIFALGALSGLSHGFNAT